MSSSLFYDRDRAKVYGSVQYCAIRQGTIFYVTVLYFTVHFVTRLGQYTENIVYDGIKSQYRYWKTIPEYRHFTVWVGGGYIGLYMVK